MNFRQLLKFVARLLSIEGTNKHSSAFSVLFNEPDPETQGALVKALQPLIEKHSEVRYRLKNLQDEKAESGF